MPGSHTVRHIWQGRSVYGVVQLTDIADPAIHDLASAEGPIPVDEDSRRGHAASSIRAPQTCDPQHT